MKLTKRIAFIGVGNMGFAMLDAGVKQFGKEYFIYTDVSAERMKYVKTKTGVDSATSCNGCIKAADVIVLAIKPQYFEEVFKEIDKELLKRKTIISIAPGITIDYIKSKTYRNMKIVRAMPNTPALIGEGMSAIAYSKDNFNDTFKSEIESFFKSFGDLVVLKEEQLDMVVPVSGSSPAYVYLFIEAMADAGVLMGLPRDISYKLAAQSVKGAAMMVQETGNHPGVLKDQVTSPGGTTIEAIKSLEKNGFRGTVIEAMKECYDKAILMGGNNGK